MPRQSAASAAFSTGTTSGTRPLMKPPDDLNELEKREFIALVVGAPPNHFLPSDLPLLACYAKAIVAERTASGELARAPVIGDKPSPWLAVWQGAIRATTTLARMLALSPGGRVPSPQTKPPPVSSYYDRVSLQSTRDEPEPN